MSRARRVAAAPEGSQYDQVVDLIGPEAAARLEETLGGRRLYVPRQPGPATPLAVAIGLDLARTVGETFGGEHIDVPLSAGRRARIVKLKESGEKVQAIQRIVGCSRRTVFRALAEASGQERPPAVAKPQLELFRK